MEIFATTAESYSRPGVGERGRKVRRQGDRGKLAQDLARLVEATASGGWDQTRATRSQPLLPIVPNFLLRGCRKGRGARGEPGGRTHLRRSELGRRAAATAAAPGAGAGAGRGQAHRGSPSGRRAAQPLPAGAGAGTRAGTGWPRIAGAAAASARRWAPRAASALSAGASAAALRAQARRELRREAGRGRDAGAGGRCPPSPNAAAVAAARPGAPPRTRTHTLARTPAPGTRPRLPLADSPTHPLPGWPTQGRSRSHARIHIALAPTGSAGYSPLCPTPRRPAEHPPQATLRGRRYEAMGEERNLEQPLK